MGSSFKKVLIALCLSGAIFGLATDISAAQGKNSSNSSSQSSNIHDRDIYLLCKNLKIARSLRITEDPVRPGGCITTYTKAGVDRVVSRARHRAACEAVFDNIKSNLEQAHWKCRDVSHSRLVQTYQVGEP